MDSVSGKWKHWPKHSKQPALGPDIKVCWLFKGSKYGNIFWNSLHSVFFFFLLPNWGNLTTVNKHSQSKPNLFNISLIEKKEKLKIIEERERKGEKIKSTQIFTWQVSLQM